MATRAAVVHSEESGSAAAGRALGLAILEKLGEAPDAVVLFASPRHDFEPLLAGLSDSCSPVVLVGTSSAGEFTGAVNGEGLACAIGLRAPEMRFKASVGRNLSTDRDAAARALADGFESAHHPDYAHRAALVFADALAGHMEQFVEELVALTGGSHLLFGGGAGGDASFERRFVFHGREAIADGAVALEMLSHKPLGLGVRHGWTPAGEALRVTEADGGRLVSLNAVATADVFEEHAEKTQQTFDRQQPLPFFLHNILGVDTGNGHKLRVPLSVGDDGAVACATEVPEGATVHVMSVSRDAAAAAAGQSTTDALRGIGPEKAAVAIFFDCVATRLRMGSDFGFELDAVKSALGGAAFAGCNSIGQIARAQGQFSGFHNCTAVVCVIPE